MDEKSVEILNKTESVLHEYHKKHSLGLEEVKTLLGKGDIKDLGYKVRVLDKNNPVKTISNIEMSLAYEASVIKVDEHQNDNNTENVFFMMETDSEVANYTSFRAETYGIDWYVVKG